jgi:hypothetical protein
LQRDEQISTHSTSSQSTARPSSGDSARDKIRTAKPKPRAQPKTGKIIHAIGSNQHVSGKTTPVLLRDHVHAHDPATPPHSDDAEGNGDGEESKRTNGENELNFDLQELGLEDTVIKPQLLQKLERIGSGGFKEYVLSYRLSQKSGKGLIIVSMLASTVGGRLRYPSSGSISARVS